MRAQRSAAQRSCTRQRTPSLDEATRRRNREARKGDQQSPKKKKGKAHHFIEQIQTYDPGVHPLPPSFAFETVPSGALPSGRSQHPASEHRPLAAGGDEGRSGGRCDRRAVASKEDPRGPPPGGSNMTKEGGGGGGAGMAAGTGQRLLKCLGPMNPHRGKTELHRRNDGNRSRSVSQSVGSEPPQTGGLRKAPLTS